MYVCTYTWPWFVPMNPRANNIKTTPQQQIPPCWRKNLFHAVRAWLTDIYVYTNTGRTSLGVWMTDTGASGYKEQRAETISHNSQKCRQCNPGTPLSCICPARGLDKSAALFCFEPWWSDRLLEFCYCDFRLRGKTENMKTWVQPRRLATCHAPRGAISLHTSKPVSEDCHNQVYCAAVALYSHQSVSVSTHLFEERSGAEEVGSPACDGLGEHLVGLLEVVLRLLHLIKKIK